VVLGFLKTKASSKKILSQFSIEVLFRGILQNYLEKSFKNPGKSKFINAVFSGFLIAVIFGLIHGLMPIFLQKSGFDIFWALGTFFLSFLTTCLCAYFRNVFPAFSAHLGHNIIASFFSGS